MNEYGYDDEQTDEQDSDLVKNLRKQLKEKDRELKELKESYQKVSTEYGALRLKPVLEERRVPAGVVKWMQKDDVDLTDDKAVDAWLAENGKDFGYEPPATQQPTPEQQQQATAQQRMQAMEAGAPPADGALDQVKATFREAKSGEEVVALHRQAFGRK